jgi:S-(hydroxymethyl)glutathione dehydrogenase/alcohol dehydrogenase
VPVGIAAGRTTAPVEITRIVRRAISIVGSYGARARADMPEILRLVELGRIRPGAAVTRHFGLDETAEAYELLDRGEITGRAVIVP